MQLDLIPPEVSQDLPTLEVTPWDGNGLVRDQLELSCLQELDAPIEIWTSSASTKQLQYSTHGIYRFFGKFPPPIARHLITSFSSGTETVLDPMCGSGTTGVEALLLGRKAVLADVSPFSALLAHTKTRRLYQSEILDAREALSKMLADLSNSQVETDTPGLKNPKHWFLEPTITSLARIRHAIDHVQVDDSIRDLLRVIFASVVRRVSKATTQQGRLFLDVATAVENAEPFFFARLDEAVAAVCSLPESPKPRIHLRSALDPLTERYQLIICHPPYYNAYRYSSINSLELAWLRMNSKDFRSKEVREAFKVGKPEKVHDYVTDMAAVLKNLSRALNDPGVIALMIGDTVLREKFVPATKMVLDAVPELKAKLVAIRVPKYTEASWVASQRRTGKKVGVNLCDYIIVLQRS